MKKNNSFPLLITILLFSNTAIANIRLPSVIASNMVLQQQSDVALWGWADPGEKIVISTSWNNTVDSLITTGDANWKIKINTPVAGGPYTITLKGNSTIVLDNIMIGEVWVCSGQSNMEWSSNQNLQQIIDEMPNSNNNNIRLFHIPKSTSAHPQDNLQGEWQVCSPGSLKGFSAVGYFFGKKLQHDLNVPVGIINASWGGTPAEVWTPAEEVHDDSVLKRAATLQNKSPWWPVSPGLTYNAMIFPLTNFTIAGAIWYQGESNTGTFASYNKLFTTMIGSWRKAWQKDIPFYYVQIAPFQYANKNIGALLQEQQTKTLSYPNTGMVVITDLVDNIKDIHPKNKIDVANRLANLALAETYKQNLSGYKSPLFKNIEINKNKALLFFDNAPDGFMTKDGSKATEFYIAGEDKNFLPADVKIEKDRIIVSNKQIKNPVAVRFAFSNTAMANLFSKEGLPVTPFRTDNWEMDTSKENQ
ncbi:MAG: sialate O-acetylesterase [Chitinophagaceae bacterium]